jgi:hypothetical protein
MPLRQETVSAGRDFVGGTDGFVGPINHTVAVAVDLSNLTNKEIDADGYLKPYIPFTAAGALVTSGSVFGLSVEHVKVADDNATGTIAALGIIDVAVATICQINQAIAEDVLDRAYTNAEKAGMAPGLSGVILLPDQH